MGQDRKTWGTMAVKYTKQKEKENVSQIKARGFKFQRMAVAAHRAADRARERGGRAIGDDDNAACKDVLTEPRCRCPNGAQKT